MSQAVSTFDDLEANTDLAIQWPDGRRTERWVWRDGKMFKHGETRGVEPFFFTGLMAQGAIVHGDFAPPEMGQWFTYRNGRRTHYRFYVAAITGSKVDLIYFIRGEFGGWVETQVDRIFDEYERPSEETPVTAEMFRSVARSAVEQKAAFEGQRAKIRNMNDARQSLRYAKEYLDQAIQYADRRDT